MGWSVERSSLAACLLRGLLAAFSGDRHTLAVGAASNLITVTDVHDPAHPVTLSRITVTPDAPVDRP